MAHDDETPDDIRVPMTLTPWAEVLFHNGLLMLLIFVALSVLFYPWAKYFPIWAFLITGAISGMLIASGAFAADIPDWHGTIAFNWLTKNRRAIFQGFHAKSWLERLEMPLTHLKRELTESTGPTEQKKLLLPTNDPTETMELELTLHMRLQTWGGWAGAVRSAQSLQRFQSVEEHALREIVFGEAKKMFAAHYGANEMEDLLKARQVQAAVLNDPDNHRRLHDLEDKYGVHIDVILESSNPDERTKKMKELPARAEGMRDAMKKLKDAGMADVEKQRTSVLLLDDIAEYSEMGINLDVKGLENLESATVLPPGSFGIGGDKKKKGDKK